MRRLREEYQIELEMALDRYAVAMTGPGNDDAMPRRLAEALLDLDERFGPAREEAPIIPAYSVPPRVLGIEEAAKTESEPVPLREAVGRVSGGYLWAYPPGIPLVVPGEQITAGLAETVERLKRAEVKLVGAGDADRLSIPVLI